MNLLSSPWFWAGLIGGFLFIKLVLERRRAFKGLVKPYYIEPNHFEDEEDDDE